MRLSKKYLFDIKKIKRPIVLIPMAADLIHHAHINIINRGKKYGSVIIGLMTDKGLESYKGKPIIKYHNRKKIINALKNVDYVIPLNGLVYSEIAKKIKCEYFIHGTDWIDGPQSKERENLIKTMRNMGGKVIEFKYDDNISSTKIKKMIINQHKK